MTTHKWTLSLRVLLLSCGFIGAAFGVIGLRWKQAEARNSAITSIFAAGGLVNSEDGVVDYTWTQASDDDLVHLKKLNNLRAVYLHGPLITDAGLVHLEPLKSLRKIGLYGTDVTPFGITNLKKTLPTCEVELIPDYGWDPNDPDQAWEPDEREGS